MSIYERNTPQDFVEDVKNTTSGFTTVDSLGELHKNLSALQNEMNAKKSEIQQIVLELKELRANKNSYESEKTKLNEKIGDDLSDEEQNQILAIIDALKQKIIALATQINSKLATKKQLEEDNKSIINTIGDLSDEIEAQGAQQIETARQLFTTAESEFKTTLSRLGSPSLSLSDRTQSVASLISTVSQMRQISHLPVELTERIAYYNDQATTQKDTLKKLEDAATKAAAAEIIRAVSDEKTKKEQLQLVDIFRDVPLVDDNTKGPFVQFWSYCHQIYIRLDEAGDPRAVSLHAMLYRDEASTSVLLLQTDAQDMDNSIGKGIVPVARIKSLIDGTSIQPAASTPEVVLARNSPQLNASISAGEPRKTYYDLLMQIKDFANQPSEDVNKSGQQAPLNPIVEEGKADNVSGGGNAPNIHGVEIWKSKEKVAFESHDKTLRDAVAHIILPDQKPNSAPSIYLLNAKLYQLNAVHEILNKSREQYNKLYARVQAQMASTDKSLINFVEIKTNEIEREAKIIAAQIADYLKSRNEINNKSTTELRTMIEEKKVEIEQLTLQIESRTARVLRLENAVNANDLKGKLLHSELTSAEVNSIFFDAAQLSLNKSENLSIQLVTAENRVVIAFDMPSNKQRYEISFDLSKDYLPTMTNAGSTKTVKSELLRAIYVNLLSRLDVRAKTQIREDREELEILYATHPQEQIILFAHQMEYEKRSSEIQITPASPSERQIRILNTHKPILISAAEAFSHVVQKDNPIDPRFVPYFALDDHKLMANSISELIPDSASDRRDLVDALHSFVTTIPLPPNVPVESPPVRVQRLQVALMTALNRLQAESAHATQDFTHDIAQIGTVASELHTYDMPPNAEVVPGVFEATPAQKTAQKITELGLQTREGMGVFRDLNMRGDEVLRKLGDANHMDFIAKFRLLHSAIFTLNAAQDLDNAIQESDFDQNLNLKEELTRIRELIDVKSDMTPKRNTLLSVMSRKMTGLASYLQVYPDDGLNNDSPWIDVLTKYVHHMNQCKGEEITKTITSRAQKLEKIASTHGARAKSANEKFRSLGIIMSNIQVVLGPQNPNDQVTEIRQVDLYSRRRTLEAFVAMCTSAIRGELQTQACDSFQKLSDTNSLAPLTYEVGVRTIGDGSKEVDLVQMKAYVIALLNQQIRSAYTNAMRPGEPPVLAPDTWNLNVVNSVYVLSTENMPRITFNFHPPAGMQTHPQCVWNESDLKKLSQKISPLNHFTIENQTDLKCEILGKVGEVSLDNVDVVSKFTGFLFGKFKSELVSMYVPKYTAKPSPDVLRASQDMLTGQLAQLNEDITRKESALQTLKTEATESAQEMSEAQVLSKFATLLSQENPRDAADLLRIAKEAAIGSLPFDTRSGEVDPKIVEILRAAYDSGDIHDLYEDVQCIHVLDIGLEDINSSGVECVMLRNGLRDVLLHRLRHLSKYRVEMIEAVTDPSTVQKQIAEYKRMYKILSGLRQLTIAQVDAGPANKFNALMSPEEVSSDFQKRTQIDLPVSQLL